MLPGSRKEEVKIHNEENGSGGRKMNKKTSGPVMVALPESEEEREHRIRNLFNSFDVKNTGSIDKVKIEAGLSALCKSGECDKDAGDLLKAWDANRDGSVDYKEFQIYMDRKENELHAVFQSINAKRDGCISPDELRQALIVAGITINDDELDVLIKHVGKSDNGTITFEKWRDFLVFYPREPTMENIYQYTNRACVADMGEQASIPEEISNDVNACKFLFVGGIAGATSRTVTAPLDRLKVALQVQTRRAPIVPAIQNIWKEGGIKGFFRGNGLNVLKVAPESAIRFYTYEMLSNVFVNINQVGDIGTGERLIAGGVAGAVAQTAIYPLDFVKTRLQTYVCDVGRSPRVDVLLKGIWIQEGPRALYRGLVPSLLGVIPYAGIDFAVYEALKDVSRTYALQDTGKMQARRYGGESSAYKGMSGVILKTLRREGYRGFYKGFFPNLLKVAPSASITYLVYEIMKKGLNLD
ncbi:hypothetical protein Scep_020829 [Stephania cephalantha]|uniref:EF-hand domain-containing protein n=1 Tax=Stephania cephalantha TaxID=152367 RepID=A0AAP0F4Y8_9MAGN